MAFLGWPADARRSSAMPVQEVRTVSVGAPGRLPAMQNGCEGALMSSTLGWLLCWLRRAFESSTPDKSPMGAGTIENSPTKDGARAVKQPRNEVNR